jgi:hypothetical protein
LLSELEVSGTRPIEGRYNLKPRNVQTDRPIPEPTHGPQINVDEDREEERDSEPPVDERVPEDREEERDSEPPVVERVPEDRENERETREQLPYNLRQLPGRQLTRKNLNPKF